MFLDISDIQDDAEIYEERGDEVRFKEGRPPMSLRYDVVDSPKSWAGQAVGMSEFGSGEGTGLGTFVRRNSMIGALLMSVFGSVRDALGPTPPPSRPYELRRSMWTVDSRLMKEFGQRGLATAAANLGKLELCVMEAGRSRSRCTLLLRIRLHNMIAIVSRSAIGGSGRSITM